MPNTIQLENITWYVLSVNFFNLGSNFTCIMLVGKVENAIKGTFMAACQKQLYFVV